MNDATTGDEIIWLKSAEAAIRLGYTTETLIDWAKAGRIPEHRFKKLPKEYRFHKEWIADPVLLTVRAATPAQVGDSRK
jgi:predicted site-specific integrase-resolvase